MYPPPFPHVGITKRGRSHSQILIISRNRYQPDDWTFRWLPLNPGGNTAHNPPKYSPGHIGEYCVWNSQIYHPLFPYTQTPHTPGGRDRHCLPLHPRGSTSQNLHKTPQGCIVGAMPGLIVSPEMSYPTPGLWDLYCIPPAYIKQ